MKNKKKPGSLDAVSATGHFEDLNDALETDVVPQELEFGQGNYEAIRHTCEAIGQVMEGWGFKKVMGSIWAFLYLCPEPASAKDICETLGISPALASITLQDLLRWTVVKKISPLGKRRDYYVAEHDVWKMIKKVLREREYQHIASVKAKLEEGMKALENEKNTRLDLKSKRTCQFQKVRIEDLVNVTDVSLNLLDSLIDDGHVDVSPIFGALQPYNLLAKAQKGH